VIMMPSDLYDIQHGYSFALTTEEIAQYNVKYVGRQKVDEIDCYVFDVSPKVIEKSIAIWTAAFGWMRPTCRLW